MHVHFPAKPLGKCVAEVLKACSVIAFCVPLGSEESGVTDVLAGTEDKLRAHEVRAVRHGIFLLLHLRKCMYFDGHACAGLLLERGANRQILRVPFWLLALYCSWHETHIDTLLVLCLYSLA